MNILDTLLEKQAQINGELGKYEPNSEETRYLDELYKVVHKADNKEIAEEFDDIVSSYGWAALEKGYKQGFKDCFKLFMDMQSGISG